MKKRNPESLSKMKVWGLFMPSRVDTRGTYEVFRDAHLCFQKGVLLHCAAHYVTNYEKEEFPCRSNSSQSGCEIGDAMSTARSLQDRTAQAERGIDQRDMA
jgi:hypothetical protein